jgi:hypothetical protein
MRVGLAELSMFKTCDVAAMTRTITITAMERPALFDQMLATLVYNKLEGWHVHIAVEPAGHERDFMAIALKYLSPDQFTLTVNSSILGIRKNPHELLNRVFQQGSDLNVYLEEDLVVSPDILAMALWYQAHHRDHWLLLNLLAGPCGVKSYLSNMNYPDTLFETRTFNSLGFVMRAQEWNSLPKGLWMGERRLNWQEFWQQGLDDWGWDWSISTYVAKHPRYVCVQPVFARANHNGPVGTYSNQNFYLQAFARLPISKVADVDYKLSPSMLLPHEVYSHLLAQSQLQLFSIENAASLIGPRTFFRRIRAMIGRLLNSPA